jgi:hypothetical protein
MRARTASEKPIGREIEIACFNGEAHSRVTGSGTLAVSATTADGTAQMTKPTAAKTKGRRRRTINRQR